MARKPEPDRAPTKAPATHFYSLPQSTQSAPLIFVDAIPVVNFRDGILSVTLETILQGQDSMGGGVTTRAVSAYLRMGTRAAVNLRNAIDQALLAAAPTGPAQ